MAPAEDTALTTGAPCAAGTRSHPVFAALYDRLNGWVEREVLGPRRARLLAELGGEVLEVGAGTGASLPHFRRANRVVASEPDPAMRRRMAVVPAGSRSATIASVSRHRETTPRIKLRPSRGTGSARSSVTAQLARRFGASSDFEPASAV